MRSVAVVNCVAGSIQCHDVATHIANQLPARRVPAYVVDGSDGDPSTTRCRLTTSADSVSQFGETPYRIPRIGEPYLGLHETGQGITPRIRVDSTG